MAEAGSHLILGILKLAAANEGRLDTRITIQKCAYLLHQLGEADFAAARFTYHYYGPYSRDVSEALEQAVAADLLVEEKASFATGGERYSYFLTPAGREWAEQLDSLDFDCEGAVVPLLSAPWRVLELAATVVFLENDRWLNRNDALALALSKKPDCQGREKEAVAVLDALGL